MLPEDTLDPDIPLIDAHHHLWDHPGQRYLFEDYLRDIGTGHRIVATVFVQCRAMYRCDGPVEMRPVGETEFANGVAAMSASGIYGDARVCAAIVGFADLRLGAGVEAVLDAQLRAGNGRLRGIRQISAWDPDPLLNYPANATHPQLLGDRRFREGFARLAERGLSFDAWLFSPQIDELTALARAFPETLIVLDHLGSPPGLGRYAGRRREVFDTWKAAIRQLATCANVRIKLGGLAQDFNGFGWSARLAPPGSHELAQCWRPYFETCIEAFTPARCMFESNFPVDKVSCGYGTFWNACKRIGSDYNEGERQELFAGTAARTYRIPLPRS